MSWQFRSTEELPVSESLLEQVIGQDKAVEIVRLAASQRRFVLMVGEPGTGKSMLAAAMSEMLPTAHLEDVLVYPNAKMRINPTVDVVPVGQGEEVVKDARAKRAQQSSAVNYIFWVALFAISSIMLVFAIMYDSFWFLIAGAVVGIVLFLVRRFYLRSTATVVPKLLVNNGEREQAPFMDATGFHAGALLGDVRHDPFQSGGFETPPHELVEPGAIHIAHGGVLFIDEVSTLSMESQQSLLTAIQERRFSVSGRSLGSSGAMVRSDAVPCDFIVVLAGNMQDVKKMHPALRSRVRGYGYEIYMKEMMPDTADNRGKLAQFVAQEVRKDGKIPHFSPEAVDTIIAEAQGRVGTPGQLTSRLRELGGLVRAAGDLARREESLLVQAQHVHDARSYVKTLEEQMSESDATSWSTVLG